MQLEKEYWQEAVACALDEAGISASSEQIAEIAESMSNSADMRDQYLGYDIASANFVSNERSEVARLKKELEREKRKVICKECNGGGSITYDGPYHSSTSSCFKCNGEGRHD